MFSFYVIIVMFVVVIVVALLFLLRLLRGVGVKSMWMRVGIVVCLSVPFVALFIYHVMPFWPRGKPLLIAETDTPSGLELCLTQSFNSIVEPYTIHFYCKDAAGPWKRYYLDHESTYWWSGSIEVDAAEETATIYRGDKEVVRFDLLTRTLQWPGRTAGPLGEISGDPLDIGEYTRYSQ